MSAGIIIDRIFYKKRTEREIFEEAGNIRGAYLTYASDPEVRSGAASGGTVTALLIYLLESGRIDGAIVCGLKSEDHKMRPYFQIAKTRAEILAGRGSKYIATRFLQDVTALIKNSTGRLAVAGLPCDIMNLKKWLDKNPEHHGRIAWTIGLFCGQNSKTDFADFIQSDLERKTGRKVSSFTFREGLWRGETKALLEDGSCYSTPYNRYEDLRNLYFFTEDKCHHCMDHFAYASDFSAGDLWLYRLRKEKIKFTGLITRTREADEILQECQSNGYVFADKISAHMILESQQRTGPYHYNISARSKAGKSLGFSIEDKLGRRVKWHQWISAWTSLLNARWSAHPFYRKLIAKTPHPFLKGYLYIKKALESLS